MSLSVMTLSGCPEDSLQASKGCVYDADCQPQETCDNGQCITEYVPVPADGGDSQPDAGTLPTTDAGVEDAGAMQDAGALNDAGQNDDGGFTITPPPGDGGVAPVCEPDGLNNSDRTMPYLEDGDLTEDDPVTGRICPSTSAYFQFYAWGRDPLLYLISWEDDVDLDVRYWGKIDSQETDPYVGDSTATQVETGSTTIVGDAAAFGSHLLEVFPYSLSTMPESGVPYQVQLRTGLPCQKDADCPDVCVMPFFQPTGTLYDDHDIFADGVCATPFTSCPSNSGDNTSVETEGNNSRTGAVVGFPSGDAWSCQFDVDWWKLTVEMTGTLELVLTNRSFDSIPMDFIMSAYDSAGNLLLGAGLESVPMDQEEDFTLPFLQQGDEVYVRVVQLNDDDFGAYRLSGSYSPNTCADADDCSGNWVAENYGRTNCVDGACSCPDEESCEPPSQ